MPHFPRFSDPNKPLFLVFWLDWWVLAFLYHHIFLYWICLEQINMRKGGKYVWSTGGPFSSYSIPNERFIFLWQFHCQGQRSKASCLGLAQSKADFMKQEWKKWCSTLILCPAGLPSWSSKQEKRHVLGAFLSGPKSQFQNSSCPRIWHYSLGLTISFLY